MPYGIEKLEPNSEKSLRICVTVFDRMPASDTDSQTDRQTDRQTDGHLAMA